MIKDKSVQKDENRDRQKDNTHDSEGFHPNFNQLRETNMNKYEPMHYAAIVSVRE